MMYTEFRSIPLSWKEIQALLIGLVGKFLSLAHYVNITELKNG